MRARSFQDLRYVVLDELHSLVTSKRGHLLSLGLARLRTLVPGLQTIGLSATVADAGRAAPLAGAAGRCSSALYVAPLCPGGHPSAKRGGDERGVEGWATGRYCLSPAGRMVRQ